MAKKPTFHYYLRDKKSKDSTPINIRILYYGIAIRIAMSESVSPIYWGNERGVIYEYGTFQNTKEKNELRRINRKLDKIQKRFKEEVAKLPYSNKESVRKSNAEILKIRLTNAIHNHDIDRAEEEQKAERTPLAFFRQCVEMKSMQFVTRTNTLVNPATVANSQIVYKRFVDFLGVSSLEDSWEIFNKNFEAKFREYHLIHKRYTANTFCHSNSVMKTWLNKAEEEGLLKDESFHHWQSKAEGKKHIYLTEEELARIYAIQFNEVKNEDFKIDSKSEIEKTRDLFIVASYTGLRLSDLGRLDKALWDLKEGELTMYTQKTLEPIVIPLRTPVIELYHKYQGHFPRPIDKSHFNKQVKLCAKIAGIVEKIPVQVIDKGEPKVDMVPKYELCTSHTGRRSFATNLYKRCGNALLVMRLTGHRQESTFMKYICIAPKEVSLSLKDYFKE